MELVDIRDFVKIATDDELKNKYNEYLRMFGERNHPDASYNIFLMMDVMHYEGVIRYLGERINDGNPTELMTDVRRAVLEASTEKIQKYYDRYSSMRKREEEHHDEFGFVEFVSAQELVMRHFEKGE